MVKTFKNQGKVIDLHNEIQMQNQNKMKNIIWGLTIVAIVASVQISCQSGNNKKVANLAPNAHQVKAEEVLQTSAYTYVRVSADGRDYWIAVTKMDVKTGETYFWSKGAEMRDFTSKELRRTFRNIYFIEDFSAEPITVATDEPAAPAMGQTGKKPPVEHQGIKVPKLEGGVTIAELYANRKSYEGKTVKIRAEVVKFSSSIMKRNWVHLQDGTKDGNNFDLTVTTKDSVTVPDIVIFEGKVSLNKDFSAGYFYEVILEDAKLKK